MRFEEREFDAFCEDPGARESFHLWSQPQCLVTTPAIARNASFQSAQVRSLARGWPVHLRRSGGTTVFHGPGVLCATLLFANRAVTGLDAAYRVFVDRLIDALSTMGVDVITGYAPGAPCDGRFNLMAGGRKLAGTAMRRRTVEGRICMLAHAAIFCSGVPSAGLAAIEAFERDLGLTTHYAPESCITLAEIVGNGHGLERPEIVLAAALRQHVGINLDRPDVNIGARRL